MTIDVARLRELHQPMYGHTGDPCSWCREWTPCPVTELLDAYEERDRLRTALSDIAYNTSSSVPLGQWPVDHYRDMMHRCIGIAARALEGRE